MYCLIREHRFYGKSIRAQRRQMHNHMPHHMLPSRPFRFQDNVGGVRSRQMSLPRAQGFFESLHGLKLQIEGEGPRLQTLKAIVQVNPGTQQLELGVKDKISFANHPDPSRRTLPQCEICAQA